MVAVAKLQIHGLELYKYMFIKGQYLFKVL